MKNLNPTSGLKQITSGYICLPRKTIVELLKNREINQLELGYFIIFLISADWDTDVFRNGFIRHELPRLSGIWGIPYSTLQEHAANLVKQHLLITEKNTLKINNFERFTSKGAQAFVKDRPTTQDLKKLFPKLLNISEISENDETKDVFPFRDSSKGKFNVYSRKVIIKQEIRTQEQYEKIYKEGNFLSLKPDDMRWVDENVTEEIEVETGADELEQSVETFFDGDWRDYRRQLITT